MKPSLLACALALAGIGAAHAGNVVIVNADPPGQGLNDPTPVAPIDGNPGTTIGAQRLNVFRFAADLWGTVLQSNIDIRVRSSFAPLTCDARGTVLASTGSGSKKANFGTGRPNTYYVPALAEALANQPLLAANATHLQMTYTTRLGEPGCSPSTWYYGLTDTPRAGQINFLDTAVHEMGHGLGFAGSPYNYTSFGLYPDIYSTFARNTATGKDWLDMDIDESDEASTSDALVWIGPHVAAQASLLLAERIDLVLSGGAQGRRRIIPGGFGPAATAAGFPNAAVVLANDGSAAPALGCAASPAGVYAGRIVLVDSGTCTSKAKTLNAQAAGAVGVIVASAAANVGYPNVNENLTIAGTVTIPTIGVNKGTGDAIRAGLAAGVSAALQQVPGQLAGAIDGRPLLYAPAGFAGGSSFSHYDMPATPDAIMEPYSTPNTDASLRLDLTPALFQDIGWTLNPGNGKLGAGAACDSRLPVLEDVGLIPGANLQAADKLCRRSAGGDAAGYRSCIAPFVKRLDALGFLDPTARAAINRCAR